MKPISTAELTMLRTEAASAVCDQACTIKRNTSGSQSSYGHTVPGLSTVETTTVGLGNPTVSQLQTYASKIGSLKTILASFPYGTNVAEDDVVTIGSDDLHVQALLDPSSYDVLTQALISQVV